MYRDVIHKTDNFEALKLELTAFRARITASKLHSLGIGAAEFSTLMNEGNFVPMCSKGL